MSNMDRPETMQQSLGRILLADDDDLFREALATRLRRDGYECVCAASAQEALEHLRATEFDTLISDIYMPGNVGLELIEQVPQVAAGLPVVLMTGRPSVETAVKSVNLSVVGYLTKPVELEPMRALLRRSVESFRCYRNVTGSRERLEAWAKNLARIERSLRDPATPDKAAPVAQYLQLMAANLMSHPGRFARVVGALFHPGPARARLGAAGIGGGAGTDHWGPGADQAELQEQEAGGTAPRAGSVAGEPAARCRRPGGASPGRPGRLGSGGAASRIARRS